MIKELEKEFTGKGEVKGFLFKQLDANDKAFLYEVSDGIHKWYEIFKKKINSRFQTTSYPSSKSFGFWAWTKNNLSDAMAKFSEISVK